MTYCVELVNVFTGNVLERYTGYETYQEADAKRQAVKMDNYSKQEFFYFLVNEEKDA